jgi:hypothetical protein
MPDALTNEWTELVEQWNAVDESTIHFDALRARIEAERRRMLRDVAVDTIVLGRVCGGRRLRADSLPQRLDSVVRDRRGGDSGGGLDVLGLELARHVAAVG